YSLMSEQMKLFIFIRFIGFLENSNVVCPALMEISVFILIDRIYFKSHHAKIFTLKFTSFTYIFHNALTSALSRKHKYLFHTAVCDYLHLMIYLLHIKFHTFYVIVAVEAAVDTVVFTVICNIKRSEQVHCISEMPAGLTFCSLCHPLKERFRSRRQQRLE